ncbi:MAG TPA: hypothetical protein VMS81_07420 [Methanomicrobiales archaeon]|jgi:hypothetical protein|nr:hypothetical protein [Methanomicrobiales archaeon]
MSEIEEHYNIENGAILIEMRLRTVMQIFNSLDPSPFHEKDLDPDAEEYIAGIVQDFPLAQPMKILIHLPCRESECEEAKTLEPAIRNHFSYMEASAARELRLKFRQGRASLAIGIGFLLVMGAISVLISPYTQTGYAAWVAGGLLIVSWVALWEPINTFLYLWWPINRKKKIYEKISRMKVEVRHDDGKADDTPPWAVPREES